MKKKKLLCFQDITERVHMDKDLIMRNRPGGEMSGMYSLNGRSSITEVRFKCSLWSMNQTAKAALRCMASVPGVVDWQTPALHTQTHWLKNSQ